MLDDLIMNFPVHFGFTPYRIVQGFTQCKQRKGFTLVELMVVVAIIAILSVVGVTVFSGVQKSARTAKRVADLKAIQTALELYYYDSANNGQYPNPSPSNTWRSECAGWGGYSSDQVIPGLVPKYMASFPQDPSMNKTNNTSCYLYLSDGTDYALLDFNIAEFSSADYQKYRSLIDPARDGGTDTCVVDGTAIVSWKVSSPGKRCR